MSNGSLTTAHLDYVQGSGIDLGGAPPKARTEAGPLGRLLFHIAAVGQPSKGLIPRPGQDMERGPARLPTEGLLSGLHGLGLPLAFLVRAEPSGVAVHLGTWQPAPASSPTALAGNLDALKALLQTQYPCAELLDSDTQLPAYSHAGIALGSPTAKAQDAFDGSLALDRLIGALPGLSWACLLLALPVPEAVVAGLRNAVINEMRAAETAARAALSPSPLGQHYADLLQLLLKTLTAAQALGAWRTGVYLLGNADSFPRLAGAWRALFSGDRSLPEPVRVWANPAAAGLASAWALPDAPGPESPGLYRRPFLWQTLLTSETLAAYVHLPQRETPGFAARLVPSFDAVPPKVPGASAVSLGRVLHQGAHTPTEYLIDPNLLKRHAFIAGVTGAGKTNTIFHLLLQLASIGVPFLVIEPAKTEYRSLLGVRELGDRLRVFTLGDETVSPFRLNPFEVPAHISVSSHLDLLRSAFSAGFGMWTPLPQVLERCLHAVYRERGWDIATDRNHRLDGKSDRADTFPTLSDLVAKVDEVARELGYEERIAADIRAALRTRLDALRAGGKGRMLDVQRGFSMELLLSQPTVLELEGVGDDDDKALLMALLLIRLAEHRRAAGETRQLQHVLVVEEAHRLLANVSGPANPEQADPRRKAVETFTDLLSEIRAYGQAVLVADQVPTRLAPEVIKNTHLKIAHRVVVYDDRQVLGGAMAMNEQQTQALAVLGVGQAAVFGEGDDAPILVQVPREVDAPERPCPDDVVARHMAQVLTHEELDRLLPPLAACAACGAPGPACEAARAIVELRPFQRTFARVILSTVEDAAALDRMWPDLLAPIDAHRPPSIDAAQLRRCVATRAAHWYASHRGAQAGWSYARSDELAGRLRAVLHGRLDGTNPEPLRGELQRCALGLFARSDDPFPACADICEQQPPVCLYRFAALDLILDGHLGPRWLAADMADGMAEGGRRQKTWAVCLEAGYELIEFPEPDWPEPLRQSVSAPARRASLCFGQQLLAADPLKSPRTVRRVMEKLVTEAGA